MEKKQTQNILRSIQSSQKIKMISLLHINQFVFYKYIQLNIFDPLFLTLLKDYAVQLRSLFWSPLSIELFFSKFDIELAVVRPKDVVNDLFFTIYLFGLDKLDCMLFFKLNNKLEYFGFIFCWLLSCYKFFKL